MTLSAGSTRQLPLVIGVSGHRALRARDVPALEVAVGAIFDELAAASPATPLVLLTPYAEGADRLVARVARGRKALLVAILPMRRDLYERDFRGTSLTEFEAFLADEAARILEVPLLGGSTPESVALPASDDRNLQYLRMGILIARSCHVLIALWNGKPSPDPGGTAQVVAFALTGRLAVPPRLTARLEAPDDGLVLDGTGSLERASCGVIQHVLTPNGENDAMDGPVGQRRQLRPEGPGPAGT